MVNLNVLNNLKENFRNDLLNCKKSKSLFNINISNLDNLGFNLVDKEKYLGDLSKLISYSKNYFEDLIKINVDCEKVLDIDSNLESDFNDEIILDINGSGILYIIIKKDCSLNLNFLDKNNSFLFIKILVEEDINLDLIDFSNSKFLRKNMGIILCENSILNSSQFVLNSILNLNSVNLYENSNFDLNSVYKIENSSLYLENKSFHIKSNAKSNMNISGIGLGESKIVNDGRILIEKNALNSIAHQKLKNIIIGNNVNIQSDPILEVKNSRVECSHGSSISKIDDEILFYLESKGISSEKGKDLIINGLFDGVLFEIKSENIKLKIGNLF